MDQKTNIVYTFESKKYSSVDKIAKSLLAVDKEYKSFLKRMYGNKGEFKDAKLLIGRVREGSQVYELIDTILVGGVFGALGNVNTLTDFYIHMKGVIEYFKTLQGVKPFMKKSNLDNITQIVDPVTNDNSTNLSIEVKGDVNIDQPVININFADSNQIQNIIRQEVKNLLKPEFKESKSIDVYFTQLNKDLSSTGDKALIPSIKAKPSSVKFAYEQLKAQVLSLKDQNPLIIGFKASVEVERVDGKIKSYIITDVEDVINDDNKEQAKLF